MSDCAGIAEGEAIPYFDITDATHTCHMIFYGLKTIVHQSSEDAFAVRRCVDGCRRRRRGRVVDGAWRGVKWDGAVSGAK